MLPVKPINFTGTLDGVPMRGWIYHDPGGNRATNAPVTVAHADGKTVVKVNQKKAPPEGAFLSLGVFRFERGKAGYVEVGNQDADGHVIIDAVQWLPVRE